MHLQIFRNKPKYYKRPQSTDWSPCQGGQPGRRPGGGLFHANGQYAKSSVPNGTTQDVLKTFEHSFEYASNGNMLAKNITNSDTGMTDSREYTYFEENHAVTSISSSLLGGDKYTMSYDAVSTPVYFCRFCMRLLYKIY